MPEERAIAALGQASPTTPGALELVRELARVRTRRADHRRRRACAERRSERRSRDDREGMQRARSRPRRSWCVAWSGCMPTIAPALASSAAPRAERSNSSPKSARPASAPSSRTRGTAGARAARRARPRPRLRRPRAIGVGAVDGAAGRLFFCRRRWTDPAGGASASSMSSRRRESRRNASARRCFVVSWIGRGSTHTVRIARRNESSNVTPEPAAARDVDDDAAGFAARSARRRGPSRTSAATKRAMARLVPHVEVRRAAPPQVAGARFEDVACGPGSAKRLPSSSTSRSSIAAPRR